MRIEIRAGEGGDDAAKFAGELAGAFITAARKAGAEVQVTRSERTIVLAGAPN